MIRLSVGSSPLRLLAATLSVLFSVLVFVSAASAANLDFNALNGNYSVASNWSESTTGIPAAAPPTYVDATTFDDAFVRNNGTVVVDNNVSNHLFRIGASFNTTNPDYDANGFVDAGDYVLWRDGGPLQNDPTPENVDSVDYTFWRSRFGYATTQNIGQPGTLNWTGGKITASTGPLPSGPTLGDYNSPYYGPDIRVGQRDNTTNTNFTGIVNQTGSLTELNLLHTTSRLTIGDSGTTATPTSTYNFSNGTIGLVIGYNVPFLGDVQGSNGNNGINVRNGIFNMTGGQIVDLTASVANGNTLVDQRFMTISSTSGTLGNENVARATFSGGTVNVLGGLRAATSANSRGFVNIIAPPSGPAVVMNLGGEVSIGYNADNGIGEMNMSAGTLTIGTPVTNEEHLQIGHRGAGTLNQTGGTITVTNNIRLGAESAASNSLINLTGGTLNSKTLDMQRQAAPTTDTARFIVDGPNAVYVQGAIAGIDEATIGRNGTALFEVRQGNATLEQVELGKNDTGVAGTAGGTVNLKGGKLKITGNVLRTDPLATPAGDPGSRHVYLTGGTLEITPTVVGTVQWQTDFINEGSKLILNPNNVQQVTMSTTALSPTNSNFAMSSGSWDLEIGSNVTTTGADRFIVNGGAGVGAISLTGGTLNISRINGYVPAVNDTLTILQGNGGVTLNAGAVTLAGDPGWSLISNVAQIQLRFVGPGVGAALSVIPEPSSIALLVFAVFGLFTATRTRSRTSPRR